MLKRITAVAVATLLLAACSQGANTSDADSDARSQLIVFAAASLNTAFPRIAEDVFEPDNPGVDITFSFEGSSALAEKILAGAPADVFASANVGNIDKVGEAAVSPTEFTKNTLRLIVPSGNPAGVTDLASANAAKLVVCAPQVPCGAATTQLAEHVGLTLTPVSEEQSVTDVRTKVETGEADAGLVYVTDAMLVKDKVEIVDVPGITDVGTSYMITTLADAPNPDAAKAFLDAVMSEKGQAILTQYGFGTGEGESK
ncbi:molybdate ABC transporter substrate-binding protein [Trueperella abortisuis]|uniref:molybdate ABC transporter substrate-binding protein n=1 Tax=Trueperella abortisuis TaxID=445930 RepID=UPI002892A85E|nr:molybdate ABC transporter substrate-binding protein [Trueperella abortisuis]